MNGFYVFFTSSVTAFIGVLLLCNNDLISQLMKSINLDYRMTVPQVIIYTLSILILLLLPTFLMWSVRNKLWQGKRAFKRYFMALNIRRAMLDANYYDDRHSTERVAKLPKIKIEFDNKSMSTGKLIIRDSIAFHDRLGKAIFTPVLRDYKVETVYQSDDGDWLIYDFYSISAQIQQRFDKFTDFLIWANHTTDDYQLRVDNRLTMNLKHTLLVGATRTGKTYGLIGLLLQMINKSIKYHLYFADPKNDQVRKIGTWVSIDQTAVITNQIIDLIESVYDRLIEREKEMEEATLNRMTGDYRDVELEPIILIFDEFSSFISVLDNKQKKKTLGHLTAIVQRGAGAGVFLFLIMQKSEATMLPTAIRSNLLMKIVLGNAAPTTYTTTFESSADIPVFKYGVGQGVYLDDTMSLPRLIGFPYLRFLEAYDNGTKDPASLWTRRLF